ncbi:putative neutral ceramidase superfamily lipid hydrolase [Parabacteroides sp. PF5-5]|uniref:hypothetical protein n=1 Tax=unclassified Parabacteroides TaxID=2649774 RepID=UPI00247594DA|nr:MULTISPECIES: hypothetical protein [unclassified Parabacteroides]MDH6306957.1 putative neutral ceramidase superfamily lipid hydrolase [Parabacteroides sp. PH5-39]MDH6317831.1 putative neutral ceramidase superfamily lipid hydrolase [Parabacteroides sp. PF5-13]MDH6321562.1 putative neutral ceramidase superfamily lipid hydrolase [Parabacteroides sp. PH5-13]MDH6325362.1 putative neutral ceramidase superfamily lipid hydrolase [Parabacteroides sp. PH5-8]MDH6329033.1 putative neutral ceramidase su
MKWGGKQSAYGKSYNIDTPFIYICLLAVSLTFWVVGYVFSIGYPVYGGVLNTPLWNTVCNILPNKSIAYGIGLLLTAGGAFLIHRMNYILAIVREKTLFPFLFYVLLISTDPDFLPLKSTSVGIFCLILAMYQLFISYHETYAVGKAYNAALFMGIGSLFWVHILWFCPLFWVGMYNFKTLNTRTFLASLSGLVTIYWFLLSWCLFRQDFSPFTVTFAALLKIGYRPMTGISPLDWAMIGYVGFLTLISSVYILTHEHDDTLRSRQYLFFLIMSFFLSFFLFFIYEQSSDELLAICCMPISVLLSHFFTVRKGKKQYWSFNIFIFLYIILAFVRLWNFL